MQWKTTWALVWAALVVGVWADTPANCTYEDVRGDWMFYETERTGGPDINCDSMGPIVHKRRISLEYPNVVVDEHGNKGSWTMIYNQGFEVKVAGRSYFAFSFYKESDEVVTSLCDKTFTGWSRDVTVRNWACYRAQKTTSVAPKETKKLQTPKSKTFYRHNLDFLKNIQKVQSSWYPAIYEEYEQWTLQDHFRRSGGAASVIHQRVTPAPADLLTRLRASMLPPEWDWRNVSGVNYVSDIRDQGACGSCYAFASMAALESRVRILTDNELKPTFSPQDVVSCSKLSQGCEGGFPYLIAGRYAQDKGVVAEKCAPYTGEDDACSTVASCRRHYTAHYRYVGGYYGACNEIEMKLALVRGGPLAVGFEVYGDFMSYKGGVYHHTGLTDGFNPFEITNHAVLVVGYGVDSKTGENYWTVKNSWGPNWGEDGYFRIRRGTDECGIESLAVEVVPIP
ncbi:dipeptidyl peptidase 1-like isoform X2 [Oratosquilla oratoria]